MLGDRRKIAKTRWVLAEIRNLMPSTLTEVGAVAVDWS